MKRPLQRAAWLITLASATFAFAQARQPQQPASTQRATISLTAFDPNDPAVTPELAAAVATKTVSLKVQNVAPLDAMKEIAKLTGYEIRPAYDGWFNNRQQRGNNVTLDIQNQPFWAAIREVCTRGNIGVYNGGGDEGKVVPLAPGNYGYGNMRAACSIRGPFLVIVQHLQRVNTADMANPQTITRQVLIQMQTFVEPKVTVSRVGYQAVVEEAADDNGNSMVPPGSQDTEGNNQSGRNGISYYGNITLPYPASNPGQHIAKLKGYFPAQLNLPSEPIEIPDPLKAAEQTKTIGNRKVTIKPLKKSGLENYSLEIEFQRGKDDTQPIQEAFQENVTLKLTDAQGRQYRSYGGGGNGGDNSVTRVFNFQSPRNRSTAEAGPAGEPDKLVVEIPSKREEIAIPFELVNLPLP